MPTLRCATERRAGVTLVECVVENDTTARRRIRVENRLDGPVWLPRGQRESGPDGDRSRPPAERGPAADAPDLSCRLAPGERCALGYATPAPPTDPPAVVGGSTPVGPDGAGGARPGGQRTDPDSPVVPAPSPEPAPGGEGAPGARPPTESEDGGVADPPHRTDGGTTGVPDGTALPPAVATWLGALEARVEAVEAGGDRTATVGHARVVADADTLSALERRAAELGGRLAGARECTGGEREPREPVDR